MMTNDPFKDTANSLSAPAASCFTIATNDGADLPNATKAIYVGTGGDITLRAVGSDQDVTLVGVVSGTILPIRIRAIRTTGTSAGDIVGLS